MMVSLCSSTHDEVRRREESLNVGWPPETPRFPPEAESELNSGVKVGPKDHVRENPQL
jgi:hypothetical protein